jgi:hypothetical protein
LHSSCRINGDEMLTRKALKRINDQPRQVNRLHLALIGAGSVVLAALLFVLTSTLLLAAIVLSLGVAGVLVFHRIRHAGTVTPVTYGELEGASKARLSDVQEGFEALCSSEKIWRLLGPARERAAKSGVAVLPPPRERARVGLLETPGMRTNIPIWGMEAEDARVFFFPEAVLIYRDERYEGVQYESLDVAIDSVRFYEKEAVPEDAEVVVEPTRRSRMPVVLYTLVEIGFPRGLEVRLLVSSRQAATRFARAFGVEFRKAPREEGQAWKGARRREEEDKGTSGRNDSLGLEERARTGLAYATLGVRKGASMGEISTAYKELARAHHPDRVASLSAEDREASERRMKEINAAFTTLKQIRRNLG